MGNKQYRVRPHCMLFLINCIKPHYRQPCLDDRKARDRQLDKRTHREVWQWFMNSSHRSKGWLKLLTAQRSGADWIPHGCILTSDPSQRTPTVTNGTHIIFLHAFLSRSPSISSYPSTLALPPCQPVFLCLANRLELI